MSGRVWYVAYGSNLAMGRFRCYLSGGRPAGGMREYAGCRDPREPARIISWEVPGGLVFAGRSGTWGGGMAFYDADAPGLVVCRAYLLTIDQFADIAAQEMRRPPGGTFARSLAGLLAEVAPMSTAGLGHYAAMPRLGTHDDLPVLTLTSPDPAALTPAAPTAPYLGWICSGLREAVGWDAGRIVAYLSDVPGLRGTWSPDEIASLARETAGGAQQEPGPLAGRGTEGRL